MSKKNNKYNEVLGIFIEGTGLYFKNLDKFMLYMTFPVLGQVLGIILIFTVVYFYTINLSETVNVNPVMDNMAVAFLLLLLFTVPLFFVLCKAVYDYIIAMGSLNSMANSLTAKGKGRDKTIDTHVHDDVIKRKLWNYIALIFLLSVISIVGMIPFFWIILVVFLVFASLSFQVYTLEDNLAPIETIRRSFSLISGNFLATSILLVLLGLLTYVFLPGLIVWALDKVSVIYHLANIFEKFCQLLPIDAVNEVLRGFNIRDEVEAFELARSSSIWIVNFIVIGYTLPLRSCCFTMWYKYLDAEKIEENRKSGRYDGRNEIKKAVRKPRKTNNESN